MITWHPPSRRAVHRFAGVLAAGPLLIWVAGCGCSSSSAPPAKSAPPKAAPAKGHHGMINMGPSLRHPPAHGKHANVVQPATGLAQSVLTDAEVQAMLTAHNNLRQQYNQPALTWNKDLAAFAQDWANNLANTVHTLMHRPNNNYGENIFAGTGTYTPQNVVDSWGSEVQFFDTNSHTCDYTQCGHFTQVIWSTTTQVGCGKATGPSNDFGTNAEYWVCNYDPAGNITNGTDNIVMPF